MKILILGGAGFIGFHLAKKLSISNHVLIVDNLSRGKLDKDLKELLKNRNVKFRKLDITNVKIKLANNFDFVFNFTAIVGVQNVNLKPDQVLEKNVLMQLASIKIAQSQKKLKKFIFSSTSEIYSGSLNNNLIKFPTPEDNLICLNKLDNPRHTYMLSKIYGEAICNFSKIPFVIVRLHNIYGPRMGMQHVIPQWIIRALKQKKDKTFSLENADHSRTFCYIDDAIKMIEKVVFSKKKNMTFNIGNSKPEIKIKGLIKIILKIIGIKKFILKSKKVNNFSPRRRTPNMNKFIRSFKYRGQVSLEEGINKTLIWYKRKY
jgi:UDP-glucose 4-epimerase